MLYPSGYGTTLVTMQEMRAKHEPNCHPEFARRLFAWIESKGGIVGIGSGYRPPGTQPDGTGYAPPGKSFHEGQLFRSGIRAYAAVDLVVLDGADAGNLHDAPAWAQVPHQGSAEAVRWGVHCNVGKPGDPYPQGESWHMQPIELDGFDSWHNAGRPDPVAGYPLPTDPPPPIVPPEVRDMPPTILRLKGYADVVLVQDCSAMPLSAELLQVARAQDAVYEVGGNALATPLPYHQQTHRWLEHELGYALTATANGN